MSKVTTADFEVWSYAVTRGWLRLRRNGGPEAYYWTGEYVRPGGVVDVYRQYNLTRLELLVDGRMCVRTWRRYWGNKTISRLAREFIEDLA
jgi:hypothetical protein